MNRTKIVRAFVLLHVVLCFSFGCGGGESGQVPVARTSGVVTYLDKPVEDAEVFFVPEGVSRTASGRTNANGEFSMTTYNTNDGAIVAANTILVVKSPPASAADPSMSKIGNDEEAGKKAMAEYQKTMMKTEKSNAKKDASPALIPRKYSDPKSSPLKFPVVAGEKNHFKIELKD